MTQSGFLKWVLISALGMGACQSADTTGGGGTDTPDGGGSSGMDQSTVDPGARFSFFVTSLKALQDLSGNPLGFGGDLRFGETGPGAGLRGADKICATIAERSQAGAGKKSWRAFLSASNDGNGNIVNAIDREAMDLGTTAWVASFP